MPLTFKRLGKLRLPLSALSVGLMLGACYPSQPSGPIPLRRVAASQAASEHPLVIVLPGRGDDLDDLAASGIAQAIQNVWPRADVLLAGATLGYYADGHLAQRLHDEVIAPVRAQGYRDIWLSGASMGGMGALLYERRYPHDVTGLVLFAPYMGAPELVRQVAAAGGPARWDPGPKPTHLDTEDYQHKLWRLAKGWQDPNEAQRIWLSGGDADRFLESTRMLATLLPPDHYVQVKGGHDWPVWDAGAEVLFSRIAAEDR